MRLIDADALMKEFAEFVKESNNSDFADIPTWNDAVSLLGSAPTVDAIPVDWIEKWQKKFYKVINGKNYYMGDGYDTAWDLLEDWEKENADNN